MKKLLILILTITAPETKAGIKCNEESHYGVDISWPMHYPNVSLNYQWYQHNLNNSSNLNHIPKEYENMPVQPLGDRQAVYDNFMNGCFKMYNFKECNDCEVDRLKANLFRTREMMNYTELGFKKVRAPVELFHQLHEFFINNIGQEVPEYNDVGETTNNHWESPAFFLDVANTNYAGGGETLREEIWYSIEDTISEWVNLDLKTSAMYGIRIYTRGAILNPHVDDFPRICSAIINVAQDVEEPWPLEVIGHDGKAYNISMDPGDMVLYESHSLIHGRPFQMKGNHFANIFIHFEPVEKTSGDRPFYIRDTVPKEIYEEWFDEENSADDEDDDEAHNAAATGNIKLLRKIAKEDPESLLKQDENGWTPIMESIRSGFVETTKFLLKHGAKINTETKDNLLNMVADSNHNEDTLAEMMDLLDSYEEQNSRKKFVRRNQKSQVK